MHTMLSDRDFEVEDSESVVIAFESPNLHLEALPLMDSCNGAKILSLLDG